MKEVILSHDYVVGESYPDKDGRERIRSVKLGDLIRNCGFIDDVEWRVNNNEYPTDFAIRYEDENDELDLIDIYDAVTGEVYWWQKDPKDWTIMDEKLVTDLLMWGELSW